MQRIPIYQVDAFADAVFRGNPAAVCPLVAWLPDATLQAIAAENNLSETAFFLPEREPMPLRWFTPGEEVPLCGHATLAAGFVLLELLQPGRQAVRFSTRSGELVVGREDDGFRLDFPAMPLTSLDTAPPGMSEALGTRPQSVLVNHEDPNYYAILADETAVRDLRPDLRRVEQLHPYGLVVSAPGDDTDFVSRYFAPGYGIPEDPVTGSIHCALGPYWAQRLGSDRLAASQLSARGGRLGIRIAGERVQIDGQAALYLAGEIRVPEGIL